MNDGKRVCQIVVAFLNKCGPSFVQADASQRLTNAISPRWIDTARNKSAFAQCMLAYARCILGFAQCKLAFMQCILGFAQCILVFAQCILAFAQCKLAFAQCKLAFVRCILAFARCRLVFARGWVLGGRWLTFNVYAGCGDLLRFFDRSEVGYWFRFCVWLETFAVYLRLV